MGRERLALWGWWWVITGWIFMLGMTYLARFIHGKWRDMRVIEPEAAANADCGLRNAD